MLTTVLPDVMSDGESIQHSTLQWVGMEALSVPVITENHCLVAGVVTATVNAYVSLDDPSAKGIHMSRIYALLNKADPVALTQVGIEGILDDMIGSQAGKSFSSRLEFSLSWLRQKPALLSDTKGYQAYQISITAEKVKGRFSSTISLDIPYSSTCPCSASLSRQLLANEVNKQFSDNSISKDELLAWLASDAGSVATPHSQRSFAYITLQLGAGQWLGVDALIALFEESIATPVQTSVKRVDEQEFARLNATNLMFCEDAGRKLKHTLDGMSEVKGYHFKVEHQESLHPHNAVVIQAK